MPHDLTADVTVIGGGIIGLSTAYELAREGADVVLMEKQELGEEQSSRNWGYTRQQARHAAELPLAVRALDRWPELSDELGEDTQWVRSGNLIVGHDEEMVASFRAWAQLGNALGVPTSVLTPEQVCERAPFLAGEFAGGMYTDNDGHADPAHAVAAYGHGARRAGVRIFTQRTVTGFLTTLGAVVGVETDAGRVFSKHVVVAGGTWSRRLLQTVGVNLPLQWVRASVGATGPAPRVEGVLPVWAQDCAFRPAADGSVTFAPEGRSDIDAMLSAVHNLRRFVPLLAHNLSMGFRFRFGRPLLEDLRRGSAASGRYGRAEPTVNTSNLRRAHQRLGELVPAWRGLPIVRSWAGYIDGTPDGIPVIGTVGELYGLIIATGFSGHGFGIGPAVGMTVSELVLTGHTDIDLEPFRLSRFDKKPLAGAPKLIQ